jgi:hypothetical protein
VKFSTSRPNVARPQISPLFGEFPIPIPFQMEQGRRACESGRSSSPPTLRLYARTMNAVATSNGGHETSLT